MAISDYSLGTLLSVVEKIDATDAVARSTHYRRWLEGNPEHPDCSMVWFNLGIEAANLGDHDQAVACYETALRLKPTLYQAAVNLGLILERSGSADRALSVWHATLQSDDARINLLNQTARLLEQNGQLEAASHTLLSSLGTQGDQPDVLQHWLHLRQQMCEWPVLIAPNVRVSQDAVMQAASPLSVLALTDDIPTQAALIAGWISRKSGDPKPRMSPPGGYNHQKLRLGYLSSDFGRHAMGYLIAELFSCHDRNKFEVYGYGIGTDDGSKLRRRICSSFDVFVDLSPLTDEQAARRIAQDEIDILIDLNGVTRGARLPILRYRPAPVQATYLGFVGPVPLPELDFLLCDEYVVPREISSLYSPKPLYIGPIFQANDSKRELGSPLIRDNVGIPSESFVFCNFSNHYKITESIFSAWIEILSRVGNSVLWLAEDNIWSRRNLERYADLYGIDPHRIIFTARTDPAIYMSRFRLADLYLDSFPYNSGTVASDALRMGLPLLTLRGQSFASRMAACLLNAMSAPLGIAETQRGYIETAVLLATRPDILASYKENLSEERWLNALSDTKSFAATIESALQDAYAKVTE